MWKVTLIFLLYFGQWCISVSVPSTTAAISAIGNGSYTPANLVGGTGNYYFGSTCFLTSSGTSPWIKFDFGATTAISAVVIIAAESSGYLSNTAVTLGDIDSTSGNTLLATIDNTWVIDSTGNSGRYLYFVRAGTTNLGFCECRAYSQPHINA